MAPEEYLIHELAKKAGVSVRTIRYYINEGLLPAPDSKGRYASYTQDYLDRLELIRRLKDAFLPLKEIRERIGGLTPEEVRNLLAQMEADQSPSQPAPSPDLRSQTVSSALDYIAQVVETQNKAFQHSRLSAPASPPLSLQMTHPRSSLPQAESWQRIQLAPGVELHILESAEPAARSRIQRLLEFARSLFGIL